MLRPLAHDSLVKVHTVEAGRNEIICYLVGWIVAIPTNSWHLKKLVAHFFCQPCSYCTKRMFLISLHSLVKLPNRIYIHCVTTKPTSINRLIDWLINVAKMNQASILENPLNKRLRLHHPCIEKDYGPYNETHHDENRADILNKKIVCCNSFPLHSNLPLKGLRKEWATSYLLAI